MTIDVLEDELFLRFVLERQPMAAPNGKKLLAWNKIATAVNEASGRTALKSGLAAMQRFGFLNAMLDNQAHPLHKQLTREMIEVLNQIRHGTVEYTKPTLKAKSKPKPELTTTRVRTRSQRTVDEAPPPKRRTVSRSRNAAQEAQADEDEYLNQVPPSTALIPYALPSHAPQALVLDRYLGAQAERERYARYERDALRRELWDCKREIAVLQATKPPAAATSVDGLLAELATQQKRTLDELQAVRTDCRDQVATMLENMKELAMGRQNGGRPGPSSV